MYHSKPRRFTQCNASSASRPSGTIALLDPTGCRGLLHISLSMTMPTRGRDDWLSGKLQKDLSLCTLFQKGRCNAHTNCFQVHVDVDYMTQLRAAQSSQVSCCQQCGDTGSKSGEGASFLVRHVPPRTQLRVTFPNGESRDLDQQLLAFTEGLSQQFRVHHARVENGVLEIPIRRVCRLHLKSFCKYGKDCKNVHLCCKLGEKFLEEPQKTAASVPVPKKTPSPAVAPLPVATEEEAAPLPIPVFRVPSLSVLRPRATLSPLTLDERSQDDDCDRAVSRTAAPDASFLLGSRRCGKTFVFDAEIAMEDSNFDQSVFLSQEDSLHSNSSSGVSDDTHPLAFNRKARRSSVDSQESATVASPGRHAIHLSALHPCSKASLVSSPACRLNLEDMQQFVAMFA